MSYFWCDSNYEICLIAKLTVWGRHSQGSPLPASPLYIPAEQHRLLIIYSSRTAPPVYISAEQHRMFVYAPWEWRHLGVVLVVSIEGLGIFSCIFNLL